MAYWNEIYPGMVLASTAILPHAAKVREPPLRERGVRPVAAITGKPKPRSVQVLENRQQFAVLPAAPLGSPW